MERQLKQIEEAAGYIKRQVTLMEVCGGHTNVIVKYGLRELLPKNIKLVSGPGCPVCVTPQHDIDSVMQLALSGVAIATYGDMLRVPGSNKSLEEARASGAKVFEVYSATEVLKMQQEYPEIVFFGIGFETTAPMTAYLLSHGVTVYSSHRLIPPALKLISKSRIDGFINPGHVSTIIGTKPYKSIAKPQAIAGFTKEGVLKAILCLLQLIKENSNKCVNCYPEAVREEGNKKAQQQIARHFNITDSEWRGIGTIAKSGLEPKKHDAKKKYIKLLEKIKTKKTNCRCGEVLIGKIEPQQCRLYGITCKPEHPQGACMVSEEGACAIHYRHGK
ncbi:MAG: hydrogenase formation protein HypD [Candidatus Woesearchaeota archaeon]